MRTKYQIDIIINHFSAGLQAVLSAKLHAAYVYGAAASNDSLPTGDIDFHVILKDHLTVEEKHALEELHAQLAGKYPPLGEGLDGYYILLEDARTRTPPKSQMWRCAVDNAWALHREHIRAGQYITLYGGDPNDIYLPSTWEEIEGALFHELEYIQKHLEQYPDYCILNLCRLIYSFETKDVVISKAKASKWAFDAIPHYKWLVKLARKSYPGKATGEDQEVLQKEVKPFFTFASLRIDELRRSAGTRYIS
jgi:hypothetical protein